jgi:ectoine hydroxylase-related dioxygenase (phytanoyl-CoA dioxygenase family)
MKNLLSPSPADRYEADGFLVYTERVIPTNTVQRAIAGMEALRAGEYETGIPPQPSYWNPGDNPLKLCKIEMPQVANRAIMELVSHPALGALAAEVTGARRVQVWWVQLLYKPPAAPGEAGGTCIGWHQDRHYWQVWEEGSELFTAWVALSDVTAEAGPMRFVRGSHRWGLQQSDFYGQDHEAQRREIRVPAGETWEEVAALLPPGGVSFHHNLTYHGSGPNRTALPRRSFAIHMRTEKSSPVDEVRKGLTQFIDDPAYCPVIYER